MLKGMTVVFFKEDAKNEFQRELKIVHKLTFEALQTPSNGAQKNRQTTNAERRFENNTFEWNGHHNRSKASHISSSIGFVTGLDVEVA